MGKEFIDYKQALELKQLGFDESCLKEFHNQNLLNNSTGEETTNSDLIELYGEQDVISAPLYQQAFKFFRENHGYDVSIKKCTPSEYKFEIEQLFVEGDNYYFIDFPFLSHKEAELACLIKLIEITKQK